MSEDAGGLRAFADEDSALAWVQDKQIKIVEDLLETAKKGYQTEDGPIPGGGVSTLEKSDKSLLTAMLDGMARNAIATKRIKSDEAAAAGIAAGAQGIIANLLKQAQGLNFANKTGEVIDAPVLGSEIPEPKLLPGETEIGVTQGLDYDSFMAARKA